MPVRKPGFFLRSRCSWMSWRSDHPLAAQSGDTLSSHGDGQRPRHRPPADSQNLCETVLRLQVPSPADEPRPAGDRHFGGRDVWPTDDRQAGQDHFAHRSQSRRRIIFEVQIDTKKNEPLVHENKQIEWDQPVAHRSRSKSKAATRRAAPQWMSISSRPLSPILTCGSSIETPEGETKEYPTRLSRIAAFAERNQAPSLRHRVRNVPQDAPGGKEPDALGLSVRAISAG